MHVYLLMITDFPLEANLEAKTQLGTILKGKDQWIRKEIRNKEEIWREYHVPGPGETAAASPCSCQKYPEQSCWLGHIPTGKYP